MRRACLAMVGAMFDMAKGEVVVGGRGGRGLPSQSFNVKLRILP